MLATAMPIAKNNFRHPGQINTDLAKAFCCSPYREATTVLGVPASLLPEVYRLLD